MISFKTKEKRISKAFRMKESHIKYLEDKAAVAKTSLADILSQLIEQIIEQEKNGGNNGI